MDMSTNKSIPIRKFCFEVTDFAEALLKAHETLAMKRDVNRTI